MMTAAAVVAALPWIGVARAQDSHGLPAHRHEFGGGFGPAFGPRFAEQLGLSDEQKAQIEALRARDRETLRPLMDAAREAHEAFRKALETDGTDAATVGQAALAMHAAEKKLHAAHLAAFEEIKAILTPEQRDTLEKMREQGPRHGPKAPRP